MLTFFYMQRYNGSMTLRFIVVAAGSAIVISAVSLLWPRLTNKPSPPTLTKVRKTVQQTPLGKQASDVLGIEENGTAEPLDVEEWVAAQGNAILSNITETTQKVVVTQVVKQIVNQIEKLPETEKEQVQQIICASSSASVQ